MRTTIDMGTKEPFTELWHRDALLARQVLDNHICVHVSATLSTEAGYSISNVKPEYDPSLDEAI